MSRVVALADVERDRRSPGAIVAVRRERVRVPVVDRHVVAAERESRPSGSRARSSRCWRGLSSPSGSHSTVRPRACRRSGRRTRRGTGRRPTSGSRPAGPAGRDVGRAVGPVFWNSDGLAPVEVLRGVGAPADVQLHERVRRDPAPGREAVGRAGWCRAPSSRAGSASRCADRFSNTTYSSLRFLSSTPCASQWTQVRIGTDCCGPTPQASVSHRPRPVSAARWASFE